MEYIGNELELFSYATNWKAYFNSQINEYVNGDVLEVGSGLGETTKVLFSNSVASWSCIEPDEKMAQISRTNEWFIMRNNKISIKTVSTSDLINDQSRYDCILYIDVLEHIQNDTEEFQRAITLLRPAGKIIILSPAHNFLYSQFDKALGHYRRYNKKMFHKITTKEVTLEKVFYLDSIGFFLSLANKIFLKQKNPTKNQILFWDKIIIPLSIFFDKILLNLFGKTVIGIWKKN